MGYVTSRPPSPGETEEEALIRDIEYYEKYFLSYKAMSKIMVVFFSALIIVIIICVL